MQSRASKNMHKIISESMLDCRDIGIGTSAMNDDDIDKILKNSHDMLHAAFSDVNGDLYKL